MESLDALYKAAPLYKELFKQQLEFALAPSRFVAALCSSRAGKTTAAGIVCVQEMLLHPNSLGAYMALTKESVRDIFLPTIKPILEKYKIKCRVLRDSIEFSNGSKLILTGANHPNVIETFRGLKLRFCIIDEAASFNPKLLQYLIEEVILLRLSDLQGKLMMIGTPAAHCSGLFYDVTTGMEEGWVTVQWNGFDNPFMTKQFEMDVKAFIERKKCDTNNPKLQREYYGVWSTDADELMIKPFTLELPPSDYNEDEWRSCIGVDFGYNDKTAISVIGWRYNNPKAYVLETMELAGDQAKATGKGMVTIIGELLSKLKQKYQPRRIVADHAGASKIMMDEFNSRFQINIEGAKKNEKAHYIELLNDALVNNQLVLHPTATKHLQAEMKKVVWNEEHTREMDNMKCDNLDATLYAYRECIHYLEKIPMQVIKTVEEKEKDWLQQQIDRDMEAVSSQTDDFFADVARFMD